MMSGKSIPQEFLYQHGIQHLLKYLHSNKRVSVPLSCLRKVANLITWGGPPNPDTCMSAKECSKELKTDVNILRASPLNVLSSNI